MLGLLGRGDNSLLCQCSSLCEILPRGPITNNSLNCYLLNQTNLCCIYNFFTRIVHLLSSFSTLYFITFRTLWLAFQYQSQISKWIPVGGVFQHFAMVGVTLSLIEVTLCGTIRKSSHSVSFQQLPKFAEVSHKLPRMTKTCKKKLSYITMYSVSCGRLRGPRRVHSDFRMKHIIENKYEFEVLSFEKAWVPGWDEIQRDIIKKKSFIFFPSDIAGFLCDWILPCYNQVRLKVPKKPIILWF